MKKILIISSLLFCFVFLGAMCQKESDSKNINKNINTEANITEGEWILENNEIKASLSFSGSNSGNLEIENKSEKNIDDIIIYNIIPDTGEKTNLEVKDKKTVKFPGDKAPDDFALIGITLGDTDYGLFMSSSIMSTLPNPLYPPDNPSTIRPTSGVWDFAMSADTGNLSGTECPSGPGGFSSSGEATLNVSSNGLNAVLDIDDQFVSFTRPNPNDTLYDSYEMSFPTMDKEGNPTTGTVRFSFNVVDQEVIDNGILAWDDLQGCTGTYPFTLEFKYATEIPSYVPSQGLWQTTSAPVFCGASPDLSAFLNMPQGVGDMSVTGGGPLPLMLNLSTSTIPLFMMQNEDSNFYSVMPNFIYLGNYFDPITNMNISYTGTLFNFMATSETNITGVMLVNGSNGCSNIVPITISHL